MENWQKITGRSGRVFHIDSDTVSCDIIIEKGVFEKRTFPLLLFSAIPDLNIGKIISITISENPGSILIEIDPIEKNYNPEIWETTDWSSLKDFDKPKT
jgi:hypothetical protein